MAKDLIIVGAGGFAREVAWLAEESGEWTVRGYLDDAPGQKGRQLFGYEILGPTSNWTAFPECWFVVAIGAPRTRRLIVEKMEAQAPPQWATLIHPEASVSRTAEVGEGSVVAAGCVVTVDLSIGKHCHFNLNATVGHDAVVGDYCTVAPLAAVSGNVRMGAGVEVGTGAAIRQGVEIGHGAFVGMGAAVTKNVSPNTIVIGNPAKPLRSLDAF